MTSPDWSKILQTRRQELGLTQEALAAGADISPSLVVKLERGAQTIPTMKVANFYNLLKALRWTVSDLEEVAGVQFQYQQPAVTAPYLVLPIRALASAGTPIDPNAAPVGTHAVLTHEYTSGLELYQADGDSMTTGDPRSIHSGDILYVNSHDLTLRDGQIYAVRLHDNGVVVKRARKLGRQFWLTSDNPAHEPFQPTDATVLGRVTSWTQRVTPQDL